MKRLKWLLVLLAVLCLFAAYDVVSIEPAFAGVLALTSALCFFVALYLHTWEDQL